MHTSQFSMQRSQHSACRLGACERGAPAFTAARPRTAWRPRPLRCCAIQSQAMEVAEASGGNNSNSHGSTQVVVAPQSPFVTGSSGVATPGAISPLVTRPLQSEKTVVFLRHGQTTWNLEKRIQGDSDVSVLTPFGEEQAARTATALSRMPFDSCYSSPIKRARRFAELAWAGRTEPLIYLDTLKEAHLGWLQGMSQDEALATDEGLNWRKAPGEFGIGGRYPVKEVFAAAAGTWREVLEAPGTMHLVVTHKSILRALLCTALGLPSTSFRAFDVNNGGIVKFRVNTRGEPMMSSLNLTSHLHTDNVFY